MLSLKACLSADQRSAPVSYTHLKYDIMLDWCASLYVNILNLIHYMHDKYYYEAAEMA